MNIYYIAGYPISDELWHHGIKGQQWAVRRYQNEDGSLTALGKIRYGVAGEGVRNMQKDLVSAGYGKLLSKYGTDGKFGSETKAALNRFKKDHGLPQDGVFDDKTQSALNIELERRGKTPAGSASSAGSTAATNTEVAQDVSANANTVDTTSNTQTNALSRKKKRSSGKKKESSKKKSGDDSESNSLLQNVSGLNISSLLGQHGITAIKDGESLLSSDGGSILSVGTSSLLTTDINTNSKTRLLGMDYVRRFLKVQ